MIYKFKSSKFIIAKLYRDLASNTELNEGNILEWIGEGMLKIGSYAQNINKSVELDIVNHKVLLPCDFIHPIDLAHNSMPMSWSSKSMRTNYGCEDCNQIPLCTNCDSQDTFYIQDSWLNTSFETGTVCMVYQATATDDEGYPLVPDNIYFDEALASYCTFKLDRLAWRQGSLPKDAYMESQRDWLFYVNSARGAANMPNEAKLAQLRNVWVRLLPLANDRNTFFSNNGSPERRNVK